MIGLRMDQCPLPSAKSWSENIGAHTCLVLILVGHVQLIDSRVVRVVEARRPDIHSATFSETSTNRATVIYKN